MEATNDTPPNGNADEAIVNPTNGIDGVIYSQGRSNSLSAKDCEVIQNVAV